MITTAITTLAIMRARRVRAPAALFSDVADMDPPTGMPRNTPAITFAAPCPTKSRDASEKRPSGLGNLADMAAPWTSPTNASDSAGTSRPGMSPSAGAAGSGRDRGIAPSAPTVATSCQLRTAAAAEVRITASTRLSAPSLTRSSTRISAIVTSPIVMDCR